MIFWSYARNDWEHPADRPILEHAKSVLQAEVRSVLGDRGADIIREVEFVQSGDDWDPVILEAVRTSDIFVALVSPSWLRSAYCTKEFATFREVEVSLPRPQRIVPIWLRDTSDPIYQFTSIETSVLEFLNSRQAADWSDLCSSQSNDRDNMCRMLGKEIGRRALEIRNVKSAAPPPPDNIANQTPRPKRPARAINERVQVCRGEYKCFFGQSQDVHLSLGIIGHAIAEFPEARFRFLIKSVTVVTEVSGGAMGKTAGRFIDPGWTGPGSQVLSLGHTASRHELLIDALDGEDCLYGQPLVDLVEGEHAALFEITRDPRQPLRIEGSVHITRVEGGLEIAEKQDLTVAANADEARARTRAIEALAAVLLETESSLEIPLVPFETPALEIDDD